MEPLQAAHAQEPASQPAREVRSDADGRAARATERTIPFALKVAVVVRVHHHDLNHGV